MVHASALPGVQYSNKESKWTRLDLTNRLCHTNRLCARCGSNIPASTADLFADTRSFRPDADSVRPARPDLLRVFATRDAVRSCVSCRDPPKLASPDRTSLW